ncbi:hypothetical protein GLX30_14970 [Streptomyces sp. Tu 2975]|uniref:hypothetical protein n=1 Tax=Streptomyces sp. Tu 2975 TaxID=2676871 RepID=UPI00135B36DA|nr:hypothetical protein [Streptomyces sp. Tu 2975]QIP85113.1 hypothetical protein GLX30_14970 [Streptomyces sp. Tu 2975]
MPLRALPPPPPPVEIRAWPDREALLADRARAMGELLGLSIGPVRLLLLWLPAAGFAVGWTIFGVALRTFAEAVNVFSRLFGVIAGALGLAFMIPTGLVIGFGLARDAEVRGRLRCWSALTRDPARDARYGAPGLSLLWFLPSFLMCAYGLWLSFTVPAGARPGKDTLAGVTLLMGLGLILWITGLIGIAKAVSHYRWALRLVTRHEVPAEGRGGAHR